MDLDENRPRPRGSAADLLAKEDIDPLSLDELDERIALLRAEIDRCEARKAFAGRHRAAADALFRKS